MGTLFYQLIYAEESTMADLTCTVFFILAIVFIVIWVKRGKAQKPRKKFMIWAVIFFIIAVCSAGVPAEEPAPVDDNVITLVAGEKGEYGELMSLNVGTEFEEIYYVFRLPVGTYKATNAGQYMDQLSLYGDTVYKTPNGWDELSDTFGCLLLEPGESDELTIAEGQIIEIHEPGKWALEKIN